jgi:hypothetical protein
LTNFQEANFQDTQNSNRIVGVLDVAIQDLTPIFLRPDPNLPDPNLPDLTPIFHNWVLPGHFLGVPVVPHPIRGKGLAEIMGASIFKGLSLKA